MKKYLVLADGSVYEGEGFGSEKETVGELVFTTGMCGYIETLTDPSYAGQIVIQTFPLIGNYGIIPEDFEGESLLKGYVVREYCETPSNFRCEETLNAYLKEKDIPAIAGVDTRALTRRIRNHGVINAGLFNTVPEDLSILKNYAVTGVVNAATCRHIEPFPAEGEEKRHVTLIDCGLKKNIVRELCRHGCTVKVVPSTSSAEEILKEPVDGIMISNGPGDPGENTALIQTLRQIVGKKPVFGICLGHQLMALAMGGTTYKMKFGHRGVNQPVRDLETGRTYITSQNHGYAVDADSLRGIGTEAFVNANDGTCEGMRYPGYDCLTVQFHPEACSGPKDCGFLFDTFMKMMEEKHA